jgi:hypothetical protein
MTGGRRRSYQAGLRRQREREREGELDQRAGSGNVPCGREKKRREGKGPSRKLGLAREREKKERGGREMGRAERGRKEKERSGWIIAKSVRGLQP